MKNLTDLESHAISGGVVGDRDCIAQTLRNIEDIESVCSADYNKCVKTADEIGWDEATERRIKYSGKTRGKYIDDIMANCAYYQNMCIVSLAKKTKKFLLDNCNSE